MMRCLPLLIDFSTGHFEQLLQKLLLDGNGAGLESYIESFRHGVCPHAGARVSDWSELFFSIWGWTT
jgi:hypothetical protein